MLSWVGPHAGSVKHTFLIPAHAIHEKHVLHDLVEIAYPLKHLFALRAMIERLTYTA